ncbi:NUDIX domain-containing protein [Cellulomonas sp.]|uniref:NUDIX domain-containing protein n=1 Tax=Cellulomonas sp. TaxID=40001 RepID=UPI002588E73D|nr:NUDIX domain-containing protein [Cellulomonas sp.]MCR6689074.1 NUDIX domain-containing protein [Cellulomonas sp.]
MATTSAGLLLHRTAAGGRQVLLAHMGGPLWTRRERAWTVPKGVVEPGEDPHAAAVREFTEELGFPPPAGDAPDEPLGQVRQSGGKVVLAWARAADLDLAGLPVGPAGPVVSALVTGNTATIAWPPRSGRTLEVPEVDRVAWVPVDQARALVVAAQETLLDRVLALAPPPA